MAAVAIRLVLDAETSRSARADRRGQISPPAMDPIILTCEDETTGRIALAGAEAVLRTLMSLPYAVDRATLRMVRCAPSE